MSADRPVQVLLYVGLSLLPQLKDSEYGWLEIYAEVGEFADGILLALPSWQEAPNALEHDLVQKTLHKCRVHGIDVYLGRDLWIRWKARSPYKQSKLDVFNPAYYAAYLSRIDAEARAIGAKGTFVECEPYGDTIFKPWFKQAGFDQSERQRVLKAVAEATAIAPPVTFAYPAGGRRPNHYSWPLRYLGDQFLHSKTFQVRDPKRLRATPPSGHKLQLNWWGSWLKAADKPGSGPLTVGEFLSLDWPGIRTELPELQGVWIYVTGSDFKQVAYLLGEAARKRRRTDDNEPAPAGGGVGHGTRPRVHPTTDANAGLFRTPTVWEGLWGRTPRSGHATSPAGGCWRRVEG